MWYYAAVLGLLPLVQSINIVDFDTCNIPYIIPLSFQSACDRSDEYLSPIALTNGVGNFVTSVLPPANVTSSSIRSRPNLWTHEPFCVESAEANNGFCVYTNDRFANGRGISIVSTPREIMAVTEASIFKEPANSPKFQNAGGNMHKQVQQEMPGKGLGVIASATLNRGDLLQSYTPILLLQDDMMQLAKMPDLELLLQIAIERLPPRSQDLFNALHGTFPGNRYHSIIKTNAFSARAGKAKDYFWAMLPETSRYNHDCRPNSAYFFEPDWLSHFVYVVKTITPGEEVTVTYTHAGMKHDARAAFIEREWGFACSCSQCKAPAALNAISDHRLDLIKSLEAQLEDMTPTRNGSVSMAETLVSLYEQEHLHGVIGDAYMYAALESAYVGEREKMQMYATKALEALMLWRGEDHTYYKGMWSLSRDPEAHDAWMYVKNGFQTNDGGLMSNLKQTQNSVIVSGGDLIG